ncbi:hypothetical protein BGL34_02010 [Fructilactobacillus lindneri]|uniref:Uncharacterized protein n=2 Tax=Fructilactobacillus lindneri TaxID=53444 RepID=A0A0R2JYW2_9LACO|nr:hypothetical protein [Fructilactobacillus lindneri]ANZ58057.1 hypothetical protein AYR60_04575 [Fructilactobacillus lindneri]ANZ59378.1 hypothetical protein AYR59_04830 [Fructilactobacillus lindneri]KRN80678.1 hypothetical protein IV52_GL001234 [Fructilactobacillus lindneri DSM 20690 = JCM 11027]POG98838.1 hypothetical protein BGL31_02600 [Fructilactobacillus lindneri]POH03111.1 hypothetical protein BGL33_04035 [Fructilactobacillus lindneri]
MNNYTGLLETGDGRIVNLNNANSITPREKEGKIVSYHVHFTNNTTEEIDLEAFADLRKHALNSDNK